MPIDFSMLSSKKVLLGLQIMKNISGLQLFSKFGLAVMKRKKRYGRIWNTFSMLGQD